jgi:hypothetical protein
MYSYNTPSNIPNNNHNSTILIIIVVAIGIYLYIKNKKDNDSYGYGYGNGNENSYGNNSSLANKYKDEALNIPIVKPRCPDNWEDKVYFCIENCPEGYVSDQKDSPDRENFCYQKCNKIGYKNDTFGSNCVEECPAGFTKLDEVTCYKLPSEFVLPQNCSMITATTYSCTGDNTQKSVASTKYDRKTYPVTDYIKREIKKI